MFEKIKKYYDSGAWSEQHVREAVAKNIITAEEFKAITEKVCIEGSIQSRSSLAR